MSVETKTAIESNLISEFAERNPCQFAEFAEINPCHDVAQTIIHMPQELDEQLTLIGKQFEDKRQRRLSQVELEGVPIHESDGKEPEFSTQNNERARLEQQDAKFRKRLCVGLLAGAAVIGTVTGLVMHYTG